MSSSLVEAALDPQRNIVVEACAGSGKTWLLVSRIIRSLLAGTPPAEILAITFTRKAAGEIQERLREWLRSLLFDPDDRVIEFLMHRGVSPAEARTLLPKARGLFETVLNAQPEISILTFDSWFERITRHAPLTAGMRDPNFVEHTSVLFEEAWQRFTAGLQADPQSELAQDLLFLFDEYGLHSTKSLLNSFVNRRLEWWRYTLGKSDPLSFALAKLQGAEPVELTLDEILLKRMQQYAALLQKNTDTHIERARILLAGLDCADGEQRFEQIYAALFSGNGQPYKLSPSAAQRKRLGAEAEAQLINLHEAICKRITQIKQQRIERRIYLVNQAGLRCGIALLEIFQRLKTERGLVDYPDLIWRAYLLLTRSEHAEYVQYKLAGRYRHVLLDEFQDTNPLQWQVLKIWLDESIAADRPPRVFMVGDPKQSIYRFRAADARLFDVAAQYLQAGFNAVLLQQNITWRNAPAVVSAVNAVFQGEEKFTHFVAHQTAQPEFPGALQLIPPPAKTNELATPGGQLRNPLLEARGEVADVYLAEGCRLADKISAIVGRWGIKDGSATRPAEYRDILILVTKRTHLNSYEAALKAAHIPYLSSRGGELLNTLEARDLTALLRFLITPFSDIDLAHVLRSPIFACSDEDLLRLAQGSEQTWWQRLGSVADDDRALSRAYSLLSSWMRLAYQLPVHDLVDRIFFEADLLNAYASAAPAILRAAVLANLNSFMQLTLEIDSGRYPSLPKFVHELQQLAVLSPQEAPDEGAMTETQNACRILTVHGAKGLESPIVFLAGGQEKSAPADSYYALVDWPPGAEKPQHFSLYSKGEERGQSRAAYFLAEDELCHREHLNLLYVAMTRAKQVLIVSAASEKSGGWYEKIAARSTESPDLPEILNNLAPLPVERPASAHHALTHAQVGAREPTLSAERRFGIQLHALLEKLVPPNETNKTRFREAFIGTDEEFEELWSAAQSMLRVPHLQRFFDPQHYVSAHNELSFCVKEGEVLRVDRLVEFADSVWVLDYKSGKSESGRYVAQMRLYREALRAIFSQKPIHCALLWSDGVLQEC